MHQLCPPFFYAGNLWKHLFGYYSQHNQDFTIEAMFELIQPRSKFFVEIGSFDPYYLSNTRRLINQGWSDITIKPSPQPAERLRRAANPNVRVFECACSNEVGRMTLWETDWPGMESGGAVASFSQDHVKGWMQPPLD